MLRRLRSASSRIAAGVRLRHDRAGIAAHWALLLAGIGIALVLALPLQDVTERCPARGEGYNLCVVQKSWLPFLLLVLAGGLLGQYVARMLLVRIPAWRGRLTTVGERRVGEDEVREEPPYSKDPFLLAATWGQKKGPSERRRPTLLARLRRR